MTPIAACERGPPNCGGSEGELATSNGWELLAGNSGSAGITLRLEIFEPLERRKREITIKK